jgi:hypothetical protein
MKALVDRWLADDLAAFDGLTLSASLPVKEQILNDVLALLIQPQAPASADESKRPRLRLRSLPRPRRNWTRASSSGAPRFRPRVDA